MMKMEKGESNYLNYLVNNKNRTKNENIHLVKQVKKVTIWSKTFKDKSTFNKNLY